ncbi:MAG: hypothetical protein R2712_03845 [Vicinamibacterales bacterium]
MATETWLVTALPYSASPADPFHVSLFVTHRLTPDGPRGVVSDFAVTREWTARLRDARIELRGGPASGAPFDIPVEPLFDALDDTLWPRVFPGRLPVRPWKTPDPTARPWQSFPAHRMQAYGMLAHALSVASSPVDRPRVENNLFVNLVLQGLGMHPRELPLARVIDGAQDREISKRLDTLSGGGRVGVRTPVAQNPVLAVMADLHAARRFYQRTEDQSAYRDRPLDDAPAPEPVRKPTPDFHERARMLGDLSPLLRKLGLVIDLRVTNLALLARAQWIQADLVLPRMRLTRGRQPKTTCQVVGHTFTPTSASGDYELGMLLVGDEKRYTVLDLDPDATALKLEQYTRQLPRITAADANGDPVSTAPATLRATGFALARVGRAEQLHDRLDGAPARDASLLAGTHPPLVQEDITRGVRLEVWDDVSRKWHSLHERQVTVEVTGAGKVLASEPDSGFLQGAALTSSDSDPSGPRYAHEVVAGWDGWSLSAPRPGKVVVHKDGDELVMDAPPPDPNPVNPVATTSEVAPGTLPRLRYGRRYAMRAFAVDLAGNSRPHAVAGRAAQGVLGAGPGGAPAAAAVTGRGGLVIDEETATTHAARRHAARSADALVVPARSKREPALATDDLKARLAAMRPVRDVGPDEKAGARGIDPDGVRATRVPEVDRLVSARWPPAP